MQQEELSWKKYSSPEQLVIHDVRSIIDWRIVVTDTEQQVFRQKIIGERVLLMLPLNVVLAARIRGAVDPEGVTTALDRLRSRHPLLAVRAEIRDDGTGIYIGSNVPPIQVKVVSRESDDQWLASVEEELQTPFPIERGPFLRALELLEGYTYLG